MILVLLGTQNNSFFRLLDEIENCINKKIINEEVVVQAGYTTYNSEKMKILDFIPSSDLNNLLLKSNLIITHGGVGSIIDSIKLNKKVIAVPRLSEFNEHVNDHQLQIVQSFDSNGYIKGITDISDLEKALITISDFTPKKYISNTKNIIDIIANYIDNN